VPEVGADEVAGGQGGHETELAGQDGPAHHAGELGRVLAGLGRVRTLHAQHLQAGGLGRQHCTPAHCPHLPHRVNQSKTEKNIIDSKCIVQNHFARFLDPYEDPHFPIRTPLTEVDSHIALKYCQFSF
jgi:hypothetical protein